MGHSHGCCNRAGILCAGSASTNALTRIVTPHRDINWRPVRGANQSGRANDWIRAGPAGRPASFCFWRARDKRLLVRFRSSTCTGALCDSSRLKFAHPATQRLEEEMAKWQVRAARSPLRADGVLRPFGAPPAGRPAPRRPACRAGPKCSALAGRKINKRK